jgi:hypothetical protein
VTDPVYLNVCTSTPPEPQPHVLTARAALDQALRLMGESRDYSQGYVSLVSTDSAEAFWQSFCSALEAFRKPGVF